jgi:anti-sigma B factor antagonist
MPIQLLDTDNGVTRVLLTGRIDIGNAHEIDLPMAVVGGSRKAVVIDMSGVEFIASMGLRSLISCAKAVHRKGGKISVIAPPSGVIETVITMGLHEVIPLYPTEAEAFAAVMPG